MQFVVSPLGGANKQNHTYTGRINVGFFHFGIDWLHAQFVPEGQTVVSDYMKLDCTIILVVHGQVDPLSDTGQPLLEAHGHGTLVHHVGAA